MTTFLNISLHALEPLLVNENSLVLSEKNDKLVVF